MGPVVKEGIRGCSVAYLSSSEGLTGPGLESRGTGDVASMRAGFKMIGKDMGGTPTCRGDARGCRMRGGWLKGEGARAGDVNGTGIGGIEVCPGDDGSNPRKQNNSYFNTVQ